MLACGALAAAGSQRVDGVTAIVLRSAHAQTPLRLTLWVNAAAYLPVRTEVSVVPSPGAAARPLSRTDFAWLAPTPANLAILTVAPPAGFPRVPPPAPRVAAPGRG